MGAEYTKEELRQFDRLTLRLSSQSNVARIEARFRIKEFEELHGKEKCQAMYEVLKRRDAKRQ